MLNQQYKIGDKVFVMLRNPHVQGVVNIQEATVVERPDYPGEMAIFLNEEYFPLIDDLAIYTDYFEAKYDYQAAFDDGETEGYYG